MVREQKFEFASSEPNSTFECSIDGMGFFACESPLTLSGLGNGGHMFEVRARDSAGNLDESPAKALFLIVPTPRPLPSVVPSQTAAADDDAPVGSLLAARRQTVRSLLKRGLRFNLTSSEAAGITARLKAGRRSLGRLSSRIGTPGTARLTLKLSRAQQAWIKRDRSLVVTLGVTVTDAAGNTTELKRKIRLRG